jgi:hypothetical protein
VRARRLATVLVALVAAGATACDGVTRVPAAQSEPIQVGGAQFFPGDLPGTPPSDADAGAGGGAGADAGPKNQLPPLSVTSVAVANLAVIPGGTLSFSGNVTDDTASIGVRFADVGTGWWLSLAGEPDIQVPGQLNWGFGASFGKDAPPGKHPLRFVAIDAQGNAGEQYELALCLDTLVPDDQHVCYPKLKSPETVFSLRWDGDADLDLHVITPGGRDVNPKSPLVVPIDGGSPPQGAARIDRDSLFQCVPDGLRQEDLVFPTAVPGGPWDIYVDLFDACKTQSVRWALTVYDATGNGEDRHLEPTYTAHGVVLAQDANGGATSGTFIAEESY